jgi:hypothetical protein
VDYDVELHIPQNPSSTITAAVGSLAAYQLVGGSQSIASGVAEDVVFDNESYDSIGVSNSSGTYTLPIGSYFVNGLVTCSGATAIGPMDMDVLKDGAAASPTLNFSVGTVANGVTVLPFSFYIAGTSAFTLRFNVTVTAAGTLVLPDQKSYLNIIKVA